MGSTSKTNQELQCMINELRESMSDVIEENKKFDNDFYLIQWLKRHNFKVKQTEKNIREAMDWWKANNMDSLVNADKDVEFPGLATEFPVTIDGQSKDGIPVFTFNGNGVDFCALIRNHGKDTMLRYLHCCVTVRADFLLLQQIEKAIDECDNIQLTDLVNNRIVTRKGQVMSFGVIMIASFKDVSLWCARSPAVVSLMFEAAKVAANYFPVAVNQVIFINANKILETVFKLMKPIIASPYYPVDCFDLNRAKWSKYILEQIEPSQLTPEFGGIATFQKQNPIKIL